MMRAYPPSSWQDYAESWRVDAGGRCGLSGPALRMISLKPNSSISTPLTTSRPVSARVSSELGEKSPNPTVVIVTML